jgi:hypothetical protein
MAGFPTSRICFSPSKSTSTYLASREQASEIGPPRSTAARSPPKTGPSRPPGARWAWILGVRVGRIWGEMRPGLMSSRWLGAAGAWPGRTVARFDMDASALHRLPEPPC